MTKKAGGKKFRLTVSDIVQVHVHGHSLDATGAEKPFSVKLQCDRIDSKEIEEITGSKAQTIDDVLRRVTRGWAEQDLVVGADGLPADFCPEALDVLLSMPRFSGMAYVEYLQAIGAHRKN